MNTKETDIENSNQLSFIFESCLSDRGDKVQVQVNALIVELDRTFLAKPKLLATLYREHLVAPSGALPQDISQSSKDTNRCFEPICQSIVFSLCHPLML